MSLYLDKKYLNQISFSLELFSWKKDYVAQARCPICGDSKKSKRKKRFNVFQGIDSYSDSLSVKCFNCEYSNTFSGFLKEYYPSEYKEYLREKFFENRSTIQEVIDKKPVEVKYNSNLRFKSYIERSKINDLYCVSLKDEPLAFDYISKRQIPEKFFDKIWFSYNFKKTANCINEESAELLIEEPRLVIPFFDEQNNLIGMQGRDLTGKSSRKYITILQNENCPKIYGLDRLNYSKDIYVVEGAFDSMFINNCVSTNDLNLLKFNHENSIYIPDNQYRSEHVNKQIKRIINNKSKIVLFPKDIKGKDINEMVLNGYDISILLKENTYQGLKAKLAFNQIKGL